MKIVIFGLSISSSWGNGHATLWRGLCGAIAKRRHQIVFFEKDVPYYAAHRDYTEIPDVQLVLYESWPEIREQARRHLSDACVVTSFCPDAIAAAELLFETAGPMRVFYDLDSPVTLAAIEAGRPVAYLGPSGLRDFDLVLSYAGGPAIEQLKTKLHAQRVEPLYGSVDPEVHKPAVPSSRYRACLSYLGTHSEDRVTPLTTFFVEPARRLARERFVIGGSQYDGSFPWLSNIYYVSHVPGADHPAFYSSANFTLNVSRAAMAANGYCPSGRLFEAAACGAAIVTDDWSGLDQFFVPGVELIVVRTTSDVLAALTLTDHEVARMGNRARERALSCHTAEVRASELETLLERVPPAEGA